MNYARARYSLEINEVVENNPDYSGNEFMLHIQKVAKKAFLLEMNEIYLLDRPIHEKYALIALFKVNLNSWEKNNFPVTQLGQFNDYKNKILSSPDYYTGKIQDEIKKVQNKTNHKEVISYYDQYFSPLNINDYLSKKNNGEYCYKIIDKNINDLENLTTRNPQSVIKKIETQIDNYEMLQIFDKLLKNVKNEEDLNSLKNDLSKSLNLFKDRLDLFIDEKDSGYSIERQWCVRLYGSKGENSSYYSKWFKNKQEAIVFIKKMQRDRSMSQIQPEMICTTR